MREEGGIIGRNGGTGMNESGYGVWMKWNRSQSHRAVMNHVLTLACFWGFKGDVVVLGSGTPTTCTCFACNSLPSIPTKHHKYEGTSLFSSRDAFNFFMYVFMEWFFINDQYISLEANPLFYNTSKGVTTDN